MAGTASGNKICNAKLVLLGDEGVGKSSLALRFVKGQFVESQESTIGVAFSSQTMVVNDETVEFEIWDTAGKERYRGLAAMYYRSAAATIVVYDITNAASFTCAKKWVQELKVQGNSKTIVALAGNKADLLEARQVPAEEAKAYALENGFFFMETSAKAAINVNDVFYEIAKKLLQLQEVERMVSSCIMLATESMAQVLNQRPPERMMSSSSCMLVDESIEPKALPLSLLEEITDSFSKYHEIGRGGFAVVYKGVLDNETVAVKKLLPSAYMHEKQFQREVECMMSVRHKNIVRFIGYCADTQGCMQLYNKKYVMADVRHRLLCFEYVPKGSLRDYITDPSCGLAWRKRYQILKGVCEGLNYLHINHVLHLDLKPENILMDENMEPKIADFGLSRCFDEGQSHVMATKVAGTLGYMPPEFDSRAVTPHYDIYSLGVIIVEILTGKKWYQAIEDVLDSWRNRLEDLLEDTELEQIRLCANIGKECTKYNPEKRPQSVQHIIDRLKETESADVSSLETKPKSGRRPLPPSGSDHQDN